MKRWLLALVLALAATALWAGAAFADFSTYHGGYTSTTRGCAACHRAHTGVANNLLKTTTVYGLCTTCHGPTNGLDVVDGTEWKTDPVTHAQVLDANGNPIPLEALKGGGFVKAWMNTSLSVTAPTGPTSVDVPAVKNSAGVVTTPAKWAPNSAHRVNGMPIYPVYNQGDPLPAPTTFSGPATIWGIGAIGSGAGAQFTLECSTCHDPHGKSGANNAPTYRILRSDMAAKVSASTSPPVTVPEDGYTTHFYGIDATQTINTLTGTPPTLQPLPIPLVYYGQSYSDPIPPVGTTPYPDGTNVDVTIISQWCATCHTRVHASSSSNSQDQIYGFRHITSGNSANINFGTSIKDGGGTPACFTCHVSHGSKALMQRQAAQVPQPGVSESNTDPTQWLDGSLLRVDNRGVCELCHNK